MRRAGHIRISRRTLGIALAAALGVAAPTGSGWGQQLSSGRATLDAGSRTSGWVPFEFYRERLILLRGTIDGKPATILIDSGVSAVIVDRAFVDAHRMKTSGRAVVGGMSGQAEAAQLRNLTVRIPGLTLHGADGIAADLSPQRKASGVSVDVILGRNIFDRFIVDIDFGQGTIAFHDLGTFSPPPGAVEVRLRKLPNGLRSVPLSIAGGPTVEATFDLGAAAAISVSQDFARERRLLDGRRHSTVPVSGVEGIRVSRIVTADARFAGLDLTGVPVHVDETWQNDARKIASPAFVGMGLMDRFRVITDYRRDRLWLAPRAEVGTREFTKDRSGLHTVMTGDRLKVVHVSAGSPAAAGQWRVGDEIVAINGQSIRPDYYRSAAYGWPHRPSGTDVALTLANGTTRRLLLEDYF